MTGMTSRAVAVTSLLSAMLLAGCGQQDPGSGSAAQPGAANCAKSGPVEFVVSGRQNSPAPAVVGPLGCAARQAIGKGWHIGIIDLDGRPHPVLSAQFSDPGVNQATRTQDEGDYFGQLSQAIQGVRAKYPHADLLDALNTAGRAVHAADGGKDPGGTVYVEDSGLQESGPVDFRQPGMLGAAPAEVVSFLSHEHEIPDLRGITVDFIGLGDSAGAQAALSIAQQHNLQKIWTAIVQKGGATAIVDPTPRASNAVVPDVPPVSLVPVPREPAWQPGDHAFPLPDSGPVGFEPDKAVFRDRSAAIAALTPIAHYLTRNPSAKIEVTGTTAHWGSLTGARKLSLRRARAVKRLLAGLHARPGQIMTQGLAWRFPGYVNDRGAGGLLLPGPASQNRSVIVTEISGNS